MPSQSTPQIVFSDLDETLLASAGGSLAHSAQTFRRLGEEGIIRVIATGRNLFSTRRALPPDFPIDFLIFSTGTACISWPEGQLLMGRNLEPACIQAAWKPLNLSGFPFFLLDPVPENHVQIAFPGPNPSWEFEERSRFYDGHIRSIPDFSPSHQTFSQILIMAGKNRDRFADFSGLFKGESVILTSSPIQPGNFWFEVFPQGVSKGSTAQWLCSFLGLDPARSLAIGNDYNDLDLLDWAGEKFIVANAPADIREKYPQAASCKEEGFSRMIYQRLGWGPFPG